MELLTKLGIDYRLLIAQFVNFLILFLILRLFVFKPVLKILKDRQKKVKASLLKAEKIEQEWEKFKQAKESKLKQLRQQEEEILKVAEQKADEVQRKKIQETEAKILTSVKKIKLDIEQERMKMLTEAKTEIKSLAKVLAAKILESELTDEKRKGLIEETVMAVKQR